MSQDLPVVDRPSYEWNSAGTALHVTLRDAYGVDAEDRIRRMVSSVGVPPTVIRFGHLSADVLWQEILEKAAAAGKLRALVERVLEDTSINAHHHRIRELALSTASGSAVVVDWRGKGSPYPGLQAFSADTAAVFCGRDAEVQDLLVRMEDPDCGFVAVLGASGSGKSSLVRAGLIPKLERRGWQVVICRPAEWGRDPLLSLSVALHAAGSTLAPERVKAGLASADAAVIRDSLVSPTEDDPSSEVFVFVDQFEELFSDVDAAARETFVEWLAAAAVTPRIRVMLAMRSGFMGSYLSLRLLTDLMQGQDYLVKPPGILARSEMILEPANRSGLSLDNGLVDRILHDTGNEPGALALMAFTLAELYRRGAEDSRLSLSEYEAMGGVSGALEGQAEATFADVASMLEAMGTEPDQVFEGVFRKLFQVGIDSTVTRVRVDRQQLCAEDSEAAELLVDAFVGGQGTDGQPRPRMLVTDEAPEGSIARDPGQPSSAVVEVAHEKLFSSWPRLERLIEAGRDDHKVLHRMRLDSEAWDRVGRPADRLVWDHEEQEKAFQMIERLGLGLLEERERAFLRPEWQRLVEIIQNNDLSHWERARIGDRLAEIGDPRSGVGIGPNGLPDVTAPGYWCEVRPRETVVRTLVDTHEDSYRYGERYREKEHRLSPADGRSFYVAKYPVTWQQYLCFIEDESEGHASAKWWQGLKRIEPWFDPTTCVSNRPATDLSWHDAIAYCRWLSTRLGLASDAISLPTALQWHNAASLEDSSKLSLPDLEEVNSAKARIGHTTAVGLYPMGAAHCGAMDMYGNVHEWCSSLYSFPSESPLAFGWRHKARATLRIFAGDSYGWARAKCGGSFDDPPSYLLNPANPDGRSPHIGFRLVTSSSIIE